MLIYEAEGFLEVEADSIKQLSRSADPVTFADGEKKRFDVHAVLCDFQDDSQSRCYVAFHDKALKKALVFSVRSASEGSAWQAGYETLAGLGYRLEDVNLRLSPAMLEVVLRDIPGLASPAEARRQRDEKAQLLAELQDTVEKNPESAAGKKAARKLDAEQRLDEQREGLRQLLVDALSPAEGRDAEGEALMAQVEDLTARLEAAESRADEERKQCEISESITEAAEKRIQELEEILVEADKKSVGELKQKRRIVALKGRIKELEEQSARTSDELDNERAKQEQFVADVKQAQAQMTTLEENLQKAEQTLVESHDQLAEEQASKSQLETACKDAECRVRELEEELSGIGKQTSRIDEADKAVEDLQSQLEQLASETRDLNEELLRERTLRESLEEGAAEDSKRLQELENELEKASAAASATIAGATAESDEQDSLKSEMDKLENRLREEQAGRKDLESELEKARKTIDSLEQKVDATAKAPASEVAEKAEDNRKLKEFKEEVALLKEQLAQERARQEALAEELAATEKKLADKPDAKKSKPLPHELRPAPNKAASFRPDWDLEGLPCKSEKQVVRAWETVFNVQISLEGYPSQYCMAFLVVLRIDDAKKLFMLFRLKQSKHTLVCIPAKTPANDSQLQKAIDKGMDFLKKSGFEMEEMPKEYIDRSLGSYFLEK